MFDLILNFKNRTIVAETSLDNLVEMIKSPGFIQEQMIRNARKFGKDSKEFDSIKESLPCFIPNFRHRSYVNVSTIKESTGFVYIDVDEKINVDFSQFDFVVASWKSLSGIGRGILVAVKDMDKKNTEIATLRAIVSSVSDIMDIKFDANAISRDRVNVLSHDTDVYYNPNYKEIDVNVGHTLTNNNTIRLREDVLSLTDDNLSDYDGNLRFSNLDEFLGMHEFEEGQVFIDLEEDKIEYTHIYVPKSISNGERNSKMFKILSGIRALNPKLPGDRMVKLAESINNRVCLKPLEDLELLELVGKVMKRKPYLYPNKTKRFIYNEEFMLTGRERQSIAAKENNRKKTEKTNKRLQDIVENWDFLTHPKLNYNRIATVSKMSYKTIMRKRDILTKIIEEKLAQVKVIA